MVLYSRRNVLASAIGLPLAASELSSTVNASPQFGLDWKLALAKGPIVTDTISSNAGQTAVALRSESSQEDNVPDIATVDPQGTRVWEWNWPQSRSDPLDFIQALAPAPNGGIYFAGPTVYGTGGSMLVGKLDQDQKVEWNLIFSEHRSVTFLAPTVSPGLILVGYDVEPSGGQTFAYGINTDDPAVTWESSRPFGGDNAVYAVSGRKDGCVLAGDAPDSGFLARLSGDGEMEWEQTFSDPEISIRGLSEQSSGAITGIGEAINGSGDVHVVTVSEGGQEPSRATPRFEGPETPYSPRITSDSNGGYICSWSYGDRSEVFLGDLTEELEGAFSKHIDPWEEESMVRLEHIVRSGDQFIVTGNRSLENSEANRPWVLGVSKSPPTQTSTKTPTRTHTSTDSVTSTSMETVSPGTTSSRLAETTSPRSQTTSDRSRNTPSDTAERELSETTSDTGSGFSILGAVLGLAGGYYFRAPQSDDEG